MTERQRQQLEQQFEDLALAVRGLVAGGDQLATAARTRLASDAAAEFVPDDELAAGVVAWQVARDGDTPPAPPRPAADVDGKSAWPPTYEALPAGPLVMRMAPTVPVETVVAAAQELREATGRRVIVATAGGVDLTSAGDPDVVQRLADAIEDIVASALRAEQCRLGVSRDDERAREEVRRASTSDSLNAAAVLRYVLGATEETPWRYDARAEATA